MNTTLKFNHPAESARHQPDYTPTPDRRYYVIRGRLWRLSNPALDQQQHERLVDELMSAKHAVRDSKDSRARITARLKVDAAKRALGERGQVWWTDGQPDYHRRLAIQTPYAAWFMHQDLGSRPVAANPTCARAIR